MKWSEVKVPFCREATVDLECCWDVSSSSSAHTHSQHSEGLFVSLWMQEEDRTTIHPRVETPFRSVLLFLLLLLLSFLLLLLPLPLFLLPSFSSSSQPLLPPAPPSLLLFVLLLNIFLLPLLFLSPPSLLRLLSLPQRAYDDGKERRGEQSDLEGEKEECKVRGRNGRRRTQSSVSDAQCVKAKKHTFSFFTKSGGGGREVGGGGRGSAGQ